MHDRYLPDSNWPLLVEQVKVNRALVTSVISYCGPTINKSAKVTTNILPTCLDAQGGGVLPALLAPGVLNIPVRLWCFVPCYQAWSSFVLFLTEMFTGRGSCSVEVYRSVGRPRLCHRACVNRQGDKHLWSVSPSTCWLL